MDTLIRILLYVSIGSGLLGANLWFINTLQKVWFSRDAVITSFKIVGKEDDQGKVGNALAIRLQAQLEKIQQELEKSQSLLIKKTSEIEDESASSTSNTSKPINTWVIIPPKSLKQASIPTQLFEPLNINVAVGGVELGQFLPWLQRWMVKERTLNFTVYYEGDKAKVAGNLSTFGQSRSELLWLEDIEPSNDDEIVNRIAYSLIQKKLSEDQSSKIGVLELQEFRNLLDIIEETAKLNRNVERGRDQKDEFTELFVKIKKLVTETGIKDWYRLIYLTASIAESAEKYDEALFFYKQLEEPKSKGEKDLDWLDSYFFNSKIAALSGKVALKAPEDREVALKKIREDAVYAVNFLNQLFGLKLESPPIEILDKSYRNAAWDGKKYNVPPQIQHLPDITYTQMVYPFLEKKVKFNSQGQPGALSISYSRIFASLIKQKRLRQTAQEADWTIGQGGIAWIKGEDILKSKDQSPLMSLKAPGTAYQNDPLLGSDPQVAHFRDLYRGSNDNGGVHINSGIPSKAFYETAIVIGSDKAGQIWYQALSKLSSTSDFQHAAEATYQVAGELYGNNSAEQKAVQAAWEVVGALLNKRMN